jgi:hypothetical protein
MHASIPIQNNNVLAALRGLLRKVLESGTVEALLVPLETGNGAVLPALVTDPILLETANPLQPSCRSIVLAPSRLLRAGNPRQGLG